MLELVEEWIWDSWYLHDGSQWHCWFLKAPRSLGDPALRHWNVTHGHATSTDLRNWTYHGTAFAPSATPSWDDYTTWTGSVVRGDDDAWHYFYTGTSRAENGKIQRIGHATGTDLESWQRVGNGLCLDISGPAARLYETEWEGRWHDRSLRDPWVMRNPDGNGWLMYFTARSSQMQDTRDAGCIGLATSPDLHTWELQPPAFVGGWGELEVPQVFQAGDKWFCLFCMSSWHQSDRNRASMGVSGRGNHFLVADHPLGPWQLADGPALDVADERYAARILDHDGLQIIGFKDGEPDRFGGYLMDPQTVSIDPERGLVLED